MAGNLATQFLGSIQANDTGSGSLLAAKTVASTLVQLTLSTGAEGLSISTSPNSIALPISPTQFVYIKNLDPTNFVTVTWTKNGGSSVNVVDLDPGSILMLAEGTVARGITALSLQANTGACLVDYFLAG